MNILESVQQKTWVSRWAGSYTFISCSFWGYQYTNSIQKVLGKSFETVTFVHRKGVAAFYVPQKELFDLGTFLADKASADHEYAKIMLADLKKSTDILTPMMHELSLGIPSQESFEAFKSLFERHLALHVFMKKTVDYLAIDVLNELLPVFVDARKYSEHIYSDSEACFRAIAKHIAQKEGYQETSLTCLTAVEFETYLDTQILPDEKILKERFNASFIYASLNSPHEVVLVGADVDACEDAILGKATHKDSLRGIVAYPGDITGTCRIVLDPHSGAEFNEGDVLVTGMTRPEFIPYIEKASAIITDVGGMLCHAAVTARELKKPCVVGTNQATKILKDGDVVEINGQTGVITIMNK